MSIESDIVWTQSGGILQGDEYGDHFGGALSMSNDATRIAVSGKLGDSVLTNAGYVTIYEKSGRSWKQLGDSLHGQIANEQFGAAVSISGDGNTVAVGSPWNNASGTESGTVRTYSYTYDDVSAKWSWTLKGNIISGDQPYDRFGTSLSLNYDGTRFVSGSPNADTGGIDAGHVRSYEYSGGTWLIMGTAMRGDSIGSKEGTSVSMNRLGDHLVMGAPYHVTGVGVVTGGARVMEWLDGSWTQKGSTLEGRHVDDAFGTSVALDEMGETVAVGSPGVSLGVVPVYSGTAAPRGYVDVYNWVLNSADVYEWQLSGHLMGDEAEKEYFGYSVSLSLSGQYLAVGAPELTLDGKSFAGGVTLYHSAHNVWSQQGDRLPGHRSDGYFGSAVSLSGDGSAVLAGGPGLLGNTVSPGSVSQYLVVTPSSSSNSLSLSEILGISNLAAVGVLLLFSIYSFVQTKKLNRRARIAYETSEAIESNNRKENVNMAF